MLKKIYPNPFADPAIAASYEAWYQNTGRRTDRLEKELLRKLLNGFLAARTLLTVGYGIRDVTLNEV